MGRKSVDHLTVVAVTLAIVMDLLDATVVNIAMPTLQDEFDAGPDVIQWVSSAYLLAIAVSLPVSGWVSRRVGQGRAFLAALGIFGVASALTALSGSLWALVVFRAVQGLAGGLLLPIGMALLFAAFPADQRARASALISLPAAVAPVLGPLIGGWFVQEASWRWVFWLNLPVSLAAVLAGRRLRAEQQADRGTRIDVGGVLLVSAGLVLLVLGLTRAGSGAVDSWAVAAVTVSLLSLGAFAVLQLRRQQPLLNIRLLGRREIWSSNAAFLLTAVSYAGFLFLLPLELQRDQGMSPFNSGLFTALHAVGILLATPVTTRLTRWRGPRVPLAIGLAVMAAGAGMLAFADPGWAPWMLGVAVLVAGAGFGTTIVPLQTATVTGLVGVELGDGSTIVNVARQIGMAVGVAAAAAVQGLTGGGRTGSGYAGGLLLTAAVAALAIIPVFAYREPPPAADGAALAPDGMRAAG